MTESTATWTWFFHLLGLDLGITPANEAEFTFINDRQKGLQAALNEVFPRAELLYWSRSHFKEIVKPDMVCNNMCEAFYKSILDARDKSIIEMLEWIRSYLVNKRVLRREWIRRLTDPMLSNIFQKLEKFKATSHEAIAIGVVSSFSKLGQLLADTL
ncbi:hypothetical protein Vadar_033433 [Vaccinium darrowii]|uniref:Uncharacterized protein n=1 Tax=Vaccinium darrowii TaxID=229202 RepID=A0ACB7YRM2_9ERIC|nr:hypothetical protein Vadar_033433 [Vaccinium darrowii]